MTTTTKQPGTYRILDVASIRESKTNPRQAFDDRAIGKLARSIEEHGLLQPIVVRPTDKQDKYELVSGARRLRACRQLKLTSVPCMVRTLEDAAALELQIIENVQRVDLTHLEEADAYSQLHHEFKLEVDDIAKKAGKSRATVYSRIKLAELGETGRRALEKGRINPSVALFIARLPERLQPQATRELAVEEGQPPLTVTEAMEQVGREFLRMLDQGWADDDAELVPEAGPCSTCPKRSGNIPGLEDELKRVWMTKAAPADVCIDYSCFKKKLAEHYKRVTEDADPSKVIPLPKNADTNAGFLEVGEWPAKDRLREHKGPKPPKYLKLDEQQGKIREYYKASDLPKRTASDERAHKAEKAARQRNKAKTDTLRWQFEAALQQIVKQEDGKRTWGEADLRVILSLLAIRCHSLIQVRERLADEEGVVVEGDDGRWILELPASRLPGVIVETLLRDAWFPNAPVMPATMKEAMRCYGVDPKKLAGLAKKLQAAQAKAEKEADAE